MAMSSSSQVPKDADNISTRKANKKTRVYNHDWLAGSPPARAWHPFESAQKLEPRPIPKHIRHPYVLTVEWRCRDRLKAGHTRNLRSMFGKESVRARW
jgi:hypothetical protein